MATKETRSNGGRIISLTLALTSGTPNTGPSAPHIRLAAKAPNGLPTTGFIFSMVDVSNGVGGGPIVATAPGFTVQIWLLNPVAQRWQSFAAKTSVNYDELYQSYDVDGGAELYFGVSNYTGPGGGVGQIGISVCEQ